MVAAPLGKVTASCLTQSMGVLTGFRMIDATGGVWQPMGQTRARVETLPAGSLSPLLLQVELKPVVGCYFCHHMFGARLCRRALCVDKPSLQRSWEFPGICH